MQNLIQGLHLFEEAVVGRDREFFARLADGQTPETLFITCSDSRISPNLLTQTRPGELFILRNAGNIVPPWGAAEHSGEAATIEYAVSVIGVKHIIVCGHSHCGAMKALGDASALDDLPAVARWLGHAEATRRIVRDNYGTLEGPARERVTVQENVLVQIENLRTHPSVATRVAGGKLQIHGWVYEIESGRVFGYDRGAGQFEHVTGASSANGAHGTSRAKGAHDAETVNDRRPVELLYRPI